MPRGMIWTFSRNSRNHFTPKGWFLSKKGPKEGERVARGHFHERVGESSVHWLPPGVGFTQKPFSVSENGPFENFLRNTSFTRCFSLDPRGFKIGNRIIQTGNGIISPPSSPLIKNLFYKMFWIWEKTEIRLPPPPLGKIETRLESKVFSLVKLCLCSKCLVLRFFDPRLGWAYVLNLKLLLCPVSLKKSCESLVLSP